MNLLKLQVLNGVLQHNYKKHEKLKREREREREMKNKKNKKTVSQRL